MISRSLWMVGAAVIACYSWIALHSGYEPRLSVQPRGYFALQTEAFVRGQLHWQYAASPEVLALKAPYEPDQDRGIFPGDTVFYQGRYYLASGPAAILTFFLPARLLTGRHVPEPIAAVIFLSGSWVFGTLLLWKAARNCTGGVRPWVFIAGSAGLAFCTYAPYLLNRVEFYETALSAAGFFLLGAFYFAWTGRAAWSSLCFVLAVGSRVNVALADLPLAWLAWTGIRASKTRLRTLGAWLAPAAAGFLLLGVYNYARFGSPFEGGYGYQFTWLNMPKYRKFDPARMRLGLPLYFLTPPAVEAAFPYLRPGLLAFRDVPEDYRCEPCTGIVWGAPVVLLAPFVMRRRFFALLAAGGLTIPVFTSCVFGPANRYQHEYAGLLAVAGIAGWFVASARNRIWTWIGAVLLSIGMVVQFAHGIAGPIDSIRLYHLEQYVPLERYLSFFGGPHTEGVKFGNSAPLVVPPDQWVKVPLDRIYIQTGPRLPGRYFVVASASFDAAPQGRTIMQLRKNGTEVLCTDRRIAPEYVFHFWRMWADLQPSDTVEMWVRQETGGPLILRSAPPYRSTLTLFRLVP